MRERDRTLTRTINIRALKYGDKPHYEWNAELLEQREGHLFLLAGYGRQLRHYTKNSVFTVNKWTIEFISPSLWFTVAADIENGKICQYYCNINQPARLEGDRVSFVDLDLDLVWRDGLWSVVDEDEFELHRVRFGYPEELVRRTREELELLQQRVREKAFPFDGSIERLIGRIPGQSEFRLDSMEL